MKLTTHFVAFYGNLVMSQVTPWHWLTIMFISLALLSLWLHYKEQL